MPVPLFYLSVYPQDVPQVNNTRNMGRVSPVKDVELADMKEIEPEKQDTELTAESPPPYSQSVNYTIPSLSAVHTTV